MAKQRPFKITPEQARKLWIKALRSGKFKQTINTLATIANGQTHYCCLGLACELFNQHEPEQALKHKQLRDGRLVWGAESRVLPAKVRWWLGLRGNGGEYKLKSDWHSLAEQNDDGTSFKDIAAIVEDEPGELLYVSD